MMWLCSAHDVAHLYPVVIAAAAVAAQVGACDADIGLDGRLRQPPAALHQRLFWLLPLARKELRRRQGVRQLRLPFIHR